MATAAEINQLYQDILGRDAGQEGLDWWTQDNQGSLDQIRDSIAQSDEAQSNIADLYDELLNRDISSADGGSNEFATNASDEVDASYWLGEGGLAANNGGSLADVRSNIMLSDEYQALQGGNDDDDTSGTQLDDAGVNDTNNDGIINDDEVATITTNTLTDIDTTIDDALNNNGGTDVGTITTNVLDDLNTTTGGTDLTSGNDSNLASGTLDQTNNEAVAALTDTLNGATNDIASLDLTSVLDKIGAVEGDLTKLQGDFSGLNTSVDFTGAENIAAIKNVLSSEGYLESVSNLDSTFSSNITSLTNKLNTLTSDITGTQLDVTDLSGDFQAKLDSLQSDLTSDTTEQFTNIKSDYDKALADLDKANKATAASQASTISGLQSSLANQKTAFDSKLAANIQTQQNNFANLTTDVNSKLTNYSEEQKAKFADVYKTREQAIGELQTDWGNRLQKQETGLQNKIQATSENLNNRLTKISQNMNYRMLGDSAAGIKMRRSKAFTAGRTSKGTGQMNRAMRIQSLNL